MSLEPKESTKPKESTESKESTELTESTELKESTEPKEKEAATPQESPEEEIKEITKTGEVLIEKVKVILELLPKFWARILKLINRFSKKGPKK